MAVRALVPERGRRRHLHSRGMETRKRCRRVRENMLREDDREDDKRGRQRRKGGTDLDVTKANKLGI